MNVKRIKPYLNRLYNEYREQYLHTDPLKFAHAYTGSADKEIAAFVASMLAYGNVRQIDRSVRAVLQIMGNSPAEYLRSFRLKRAVEEFADFRHRFNTGRDVVQTFYYFSIILKEYNSLEDFFLVGYTKHDPDTGSALASFCGRILSADPGPLYPDGNLPDKAGVRYFFASPANGSACKRMNLFLRWVVRRDDDLDLGLWRRIDPAKLIIPLDVHVTRIAQRIGLTKRKNPDWKMAAEITENLRKLDPVDPVKYDFALCRPGILKKCSGRREHEMCKSCEIYHICCS